MKSFFDDYRVCPICNASKLILVRELPTVRTNHMVMLYHCPSCRSFSNPSGYVEDDAALKGDLGWNIGVAERNKSWARNLFNEVLAYRPRIKTVLEIGCGIGTTLHVAKEEFSLDVEGYDLNEKATDWGRANYHLNLHSRKWAAGGSGPSDLTLCISCLEHIGQPLPLIFELCEHVKKYRGLLFISVPFFGPHLWPFIDDPNPSLAGTPFFDNDVHITHFSKIGLCLAIHNQGLSCRAFNVGGWSGFLIDANPRFSQRLVNWRQYQILKKQLSTQVREYLSRGKGSIVLKKALRICD